LRASSWRGVFQYYPRVSPYPDERTSAAIAAHWAPADPPAEQDRERKVTEVAVGRANVLTFERIRLALDSASPPSLSAIAKAERLSKQTVLD
jgi:hypothetical protein